MAAKAKPAKSNRHLPRAFASDVIIRIGAFAETFSLHQMEDTSNRRAVKLVMLDDADHRVEQVYLCAERTCTYPAGQDGFKVSDLTHRGRESGKDVIPLTPEELAEAQDTKLEKNLLELHLCPAVEVDALTWPTGTAYWVEPIRAEPLYAALSTKLAEGEMAGVGTINLRGTAKFVRLIPHRGGFVLQEMLRPSDTWSYDPLPVDVPEKYKALFETLFEAATDEFDPEEFESERVAALRALIASKETGEPLASVTPIKAAAAPSDDLEAQLAASLAILQAAKAAKKAS